MVDLEARPCPPGPPAPSTPAALVSLGLVRPGPAAAHGTAAWPSGPSGALHTSGAWCTEGVQSPARPRRRPRALQPGPVAWPCRRPPGPRLCPAAREARRPHFVRRRASKPGHTGTAVRPFGSSGALHTGGTWCAVVSTGSASTLYAVQSSPCSGCWWPKRYKVRPARTKLAKTGHFERAGRVLYRTCNEEGCAGRFLYRKRGRMARAGRILSRPPAL